MTGAQTLDIARDAIWTLIIISAPMMLVGLAVGVVIALFQALTQINEATLSFVPKLVAAVAVFALAGPWMLSTLVDFIRRTLMAIPDFAV